MVPQLPRLRAVMPKSWAPGGEMRYFLLTENAWILP
jgi:hypothetical protein